MAVDLTKIAFHSGYPAFKNNRVYTGTLTISGSSSPGTNTRTFNVALDEEPDLLDVLFNGPTNLITGEDPRPSNGWFRDGRVWVPTNNAGGGSPSPWVISYSISGTTLTILATYVQQFTPGETLTSTNFSYRIVDYSVF